MMRVEKSSWKTDQNELCTCYHKSGYAIYAPNWLCTCYHKSGYAIYAPALLARSVHWRHRATPPLRCPSSYWTAAVNNGKHIFHTKLHSYHKKFPPSHRNQTFGTYITLQLTRLMKNTINRWSPDRYFSTLCCDLNLQQLSWQSPVAVHPVWAAPAQPLASVTFSGHSDSAEVPTGRSLTANENKYTQNVT